MLGDPLPNDENPLLPVSVVIGRGVGVLAMTFSSFVRMKEANTSAVEEEGPVGPVTPFVPFAPVGPVAPVGPAGPPDGPVGPVGPAHELHPGRM